MRRLDIPATVQRLTVFIRTSLNEAGFSRLTVAVSGGVDSATAASLAASALGPTNVFVLLLPYLDWHNDSRARTSELVNQLHIPVSNIREINIAPMVNTFRESLRLSHQAMQTQIEDREAEHIRLGNIMARVRMIALFDYAREVRALVLGTENKSEHYLGYYTRFGDEASDLEPLRSLYKTEVYQVAKFLGIPDDIVAAVPSAGLWPGQTDEGQFGFTYSQADEVLYGLHEAGLKSEDLPAHGLKQAVVKAVLAWEKQVAYKHELPKLAPEPVVIETE